MLQNFQSYLNAYILSFHSELYNNNNYLLMPIFMVIVLSFSQLAVKLE